MNTLDSYVHKRHSKTSQSLSRPIAASHVTMSVVKLLSRIVAPSENELANSGASTLHDHTYGITSDPIIQFACVLYVIILKDCVRILKEFDVDTFPFLVLQICSNS